MNLIENILVIVDPTASSHPAVAKAAILATKLSARLELFVCDTSLSSSRQKPSGALSHAKVLLESMAKPMRDSGLDVTTETNYGGPLHEALVDRATHACADLVVKDTHHHSLAQRTVLTNTDWELIRGCPTALLLVKAPAWNTTPTVIAAVDPGHANDKPASLDRLILDHAAMLRRQLAGQLHVLHSYLPISVASAVLSSVPPMVVDAPPEALNIERQNKLEALQKVLPGYSVDAANIHLLMGGPADMMCRLSSQLHADIVCMGAISRSGWKRMLIGSTAEKVLEQLPCDAWIVKPADFAELLSY